MILALFDRLPYDFLLGFSGAFVSYSFPDFIIGPLVYGNLNGSHDPKNVRLRSDLIIDRTENILMGRMTRNFHKVFCVVNLKKKFIYYFVIFSKYDAGKKC